MTLHLVHSSDVVQKFIDQSTQDRDKHAKLRDDALSNANDRLTNTKAFVDVLVNFSTDVTPDQIDVAIADTQAILRRLKSARDHADVS